MKAFVEKLSAVFQELLTVINLLTEGIIVFMKTVFAYICPILINVVLIILPLAVLIGFGFFSKLYLILHPK